MSKRTEQTGNGIYAGRRIGPWSTGLRFYQDFMVPQGR
jgi:hypothetical protein